jgi:hypothetical protein
MMSSYQRFIYFWRYFYGGILIVHHGASDKDGNAFSDHPGRLLIVAAARTMADVQHTRDIQTHLNEGLYPCWWICRNG